MHLNTLSKINLGITCPMANEASTACLFVKEVLNKCNQLSFNSVTMFTIFDKKCTDGTYKLLCEIGKDIQELKVIYAPENKCVVDAYIRGYKEACVHNCDWILEIDAGYSHQPSDIPKFINKMKEGYDCVFGSRFCKGAKITDSNMKRYLLSRVGTIVTNYLMGTKLSDMTSGFELFTKDVLEDVLQKGIRSRGPFFQTEIKTFTHKYSIAEVPIHYRAPTHSIGRKAINDALGNLWHIFKEQRLRIQSNGS